MLVNSLVGTIYWRDVRTVPNIFPSFVTSFLRMGLVVRNYEFQFLHRLQKITVAGKYPSAQLYR